MIGGIASTGVVFASAGFRGEVLPFLLPCAAAAVTSVILTALCAAALLHRPAPSLVLPAIGVWSTAIVAIFIMTITSEAAEFWPFLLGCYVMVAARPPLMLKNYLAAVKSRAYSQTHQI